MYDDLSDFLYRAVKDLKFDEILELDKNKISDLKDQVLNIFSKNYELKEYSGESVVTERSTGKVVRDQFYNALTLNQVLNKIAKKVQPFYGLEKEVKKIPSEQEFTRYMRRSGISKKSQLRGRLYQEWIFAHKDEKVKQASEYWF